MYVWHAFGFVAAALVIAAFCMEDILHLRIVGSECADFLHK